MIDYIFIVNPVAGKADRTDPILKATSSIEVDGNIEVYTTTEPGDATRYLEERLKNVTSPVRVFACGGDGTLHEVVEGVIRSGNPRVAVGPIPTGSGNDFIKSFNIQESQFRSIRNMMNGKIVPCDVIKLTDDTGVETYSINIASAGFDAEVCFGMTKLKNNPLVSGSGAYKLSLTRQFFSHLGHKYKVLVDGKQIGTKLKDEYMFVVGANGKYYGGGYMASPKSKIDDGLMNLIIIERLNRIDFLKIVGAYQKGEYFEKLKGRMIHKTVQKFQILADEPIEMNVDGENVLMKNPVLELLPSPIMLILPE